MMLMISAHLGLDFHVGMSKKPKLILLIHESCLNRGVPSGYTRLVQSSEFSLAFIVSQRK